MTKKIMQSAVKSKSISAITLFSALLISSCQNITHQSPVNKVSETTSDKSKTIVSTYIGGEVTLQDVNNEVEKLIAKDEKLKGLSFEKLTLEQKEVIIKEVVLKRVMRDEAKKRKLDKESDYQEALKTFELELLKQKLVATLIKETVSEENLKKNYEELVAKLNGKQEVRVSYIAVKTKEEAQKIHGHLLNSPSSFANQAKKKSVDQATAKKGGDLGFVVENAIPEEVLREIRKAGKNKITDPIAVSGKWVIAKLTNEKPVEIMPFEKAKDALASSLAKKTLDEFISKNLEKTKITILVK